MKRNIQNPDCAGKDESENDQDSQSTQFQNHLKFIAATDNLIRFIQREQEQEKQTSTCSTKAKFRSEVMMSALTLFQELFIRVHNGPNHV